MKALRLVRFNLVQINLRLLTFLMMTRGRVVLEIPKQSGKNLYCDDKKIKGNWVPLS